MARVSVVVPVFNEGARIVDFLDRVFEAITLPCEVLTVYDSPEDTTVTHLESYARHEARLRPLHNTYGRGPAAALRFGIDHAESQVVVVTMADGSDDPHQIDQLARLVERGVAVAAASRYMRGGQQVGGPWLKGRISAVADRSLHLLGRVGTHDATNSFKAYSRDFIRAAGIEFGHGIHARHRDGGQGQAAWSACGRDSHHLARPRRGDLQFPGVEVDCEVPSLVPGGAPAQPPSTQTGALGGGEP